MPSDSEAIRDVLVRYATAIDDKNWALLRTCFTADASTDYGDIGKWSDADGIVAFMEAAHQGFRATNHMLSNFVVRVDGDRARATTYFHAVLSFAGDEAAWVDSVGRYEDTLVRAADGWQIASRRTLMTRLLRG
ncbi:MAG: nuclear transport factor 2 family protein [Deltaproteobacteria bacterium]|nr:nuclear transport factor 2 family protein [Deltaproteobacteria bacterium]